MAPAYYIRPLYITTPPSYGHHPCPITRSHDRSPTVQPVLNLHAVAIDGTDLPVRTNVCRSSTFESNLPSRGRVVHVAAVIGIHVSGAAIGRTARLTRIHIVSRMAIVSGTRLTRAARGLAHGVGR